MFDLVAERDALQESVRALGVGSYVTQREVGGLIGLVTKGLRVKTREQRIQVMRYLIGDAVRDALGVEFESFKNMNSPIASLLIDLLVVPESTPWELNAYGRQLIAAAESELEVRSPL